MKPDMTDRDMSHISDMSDMSYCDTDTPQRQSPEST
jgi:hypothetical protein